jgi:hypothetical protein
MNITINYRVGDSTGCSCVAWTEFRGQSFTRCGKTWEEAKNDLIKRVKEFMATTVPPQETVSIDDGSEGKVLEWQEELKDWVDPERKLEQKEEVPQ